MGGRIRVRSKHKNTKRKNTKRKNTKRKNTKRKNTRRKNTKRKNTKRNNTSRKNTRRKHTRRRTYRGGMTPDFTEECIMPIDPPLVATRRYGQGMGKNIKPESFQKFLKNKFNLEINDDINGVVENRLKKLTLLFKKHPELDEMTYSDFLVGLDELVKKKGMDVCDRQKGGSPEGLNYSEPHQDRFTIINGTPANALHARSRDVLGEILATASGTGGNITYINGIDGNGPDEPTRAVIDVTFTNGGVITPRSTDSLDEDEHTQSDTMPGYLRVLAIIGVTMLGILLCVYYIYIHLPRAHQGRVAPATRAADGMRLHRYTASTDRQSNP
jgi:hypothetical protein